MHLLKFNQPCALGLTPLKILFMRSLLLLVFFCVIFATLFAQKSKESEKLTIEINYNAELLGLAYFVGFEGVDIESKTVEVNGRNIPKKDLHKYGYYIYEKYKKYAASEHLAKSFTVADHLWLDYILNLLIQLDNFPNARITPGIHLKYFVNFSQKKDSAEATKNVQIFLDGLNNFHNEIDFKGYMNSSKAFYAAAIMEVKGNLLKSDYIGAMESFYNKKFHRYTLVPSLTIPKGMGFGLNFTKNERTTLFNIFGAFDDQNFQGADTLNLGFANTQRLQELSIHEFGHSFVNPVVDSIPSGDILKTERLFEPIKSAMEKQGYNTWKTCLYEHFVRAGEVVIAKLLGDVKSADKLRTNYIDDRKFIYLPEIIASLENNHKTNGTYYHAVINSMQELNKK